jgi:phosphatidate cytidylyltransferase
MISVLLAHGVALAVEYGDNGIALVISLTTACAFSDVCAFLFGKTFGRRPLSPRLSPNKTIEGVVGNLVGAAAGIALFAPAIAPTFGTAFTLVLVPVVAVGSVWGDLFESAAKREAGVKDAGSWLPGFGGILDRIDSLLLTLAVAYWLTRVWVAFD